MKEFVRNRCPFVLLRVEGYEIRIREPTGRHGLLRCLGGLSHR